MDLVPFRIFQVELTNFCNLKCSYCPHPNMGRDKGHMSEETFARCIERAKSAGQSGLSLHHFGEPFLHPQLEDRLRQMADANINIHFSSNGILLRRNLDMLFKIRQPISITLSVHQWVENPQGYFDEFESLEEITAKSNVHIQRAHNIYGDQFRFHTWADGKQRAIDLNKCSFLRDNSGVVLWDGRIVSCCLDCHGECVIGNINDTTDKQIETVPWRGCRVCVFN